ncbi:hypothetical protein Rleg2_5082 (plasmid) [Rhizobium leguminosarum bv. trifolii WSM2304]|uniref:Uncharacterized protein n=1 Tax=Rhizobium leguminosarum bv. trifolii (strain WSM2304) TaxID=395492 RepID=A0ABF7QVU4_RHILW|nr:hypothetical protein Rleg2_5082 [Rhizobium leguminosarum bv. trifolii WSM2304]
MQHLSGVNARLFQAVDNKAAVVENYGTMRP